MENMWSLRAEASFNERLRKIVPTDSGAIRTAKGPRKGLSGNAGLRIKSTVSKPPHSHRSYLIYQIFLSDVRHAVHIRFRRRLWLGSQDINT